MTDPHVEIVKRIVERWNSGERTPPLEFAHPDIEIDAAVAGAFRGEPFKGYEGMGEWLGGLDEAFERWDVEMVEIEERDGVVLMTGNVQARGRGSGVELALSTNWVVEFREGKIFRVRVSRDSDRARSAFGSE